MRIFQEFFKNARVPEFLCEENLETGVGMEIGEARRLIVQYTKKGNMFILKSELLKNQVFPNVTHLAIVGANDIHPFKLSFPDLKSLLFHDCDKNTHYYWVPYLLSSSPITHLYLNGHPCSPSLVDFVLDTVEQSSPLQLTIGKSYEDKWFRYRGRERFAHMVQSKCIKLANPIFFEAMARNHRKNLV